MAGLDYDVVVGSGFGGRVAALRLTEKGYRAAVLEAGSASTIRPATHPPTGTAPCRGTPGTRAATCGQPRCVNPSLTITAQAERAMAAWPNRGDPDPRPPLGASYRRVAAVSPARPAVPAGAPAALRVPA